MNTRASTQGIEPIKTVGLYLKENRRLIKDERIKKVVVVAPHPDDDVIGCGALLFYLSQMLLNSHDHKGFLSIESVSIVYAVSGFNGVTERFLEKSDYSITIDDLKRKTEEEIRKIKTRIRQEEAISCCHILGVDPVFWILPFYEQQKNTFTALDLAIAVESLEKLQPDLIVLIDEVSDPHGTHGLVRNIVLQALRESKFDGKLIGYRIWGKEYSVAQCDIILFFDKVVMQKKEKFIQCYKSQLIDPAYPCRYKNFIELAKIMNASIARQHSTEWPYAECYRILDVATLV